MASARNQSIKKMSPRQKMINLMYIVLTAMLALNVSSDVLNGFTQVEDGLTRSNRTVNERNESLFGRLKAFTEKNPEKGKIWLDKAIAVRQSTAQIYDYIDSLKLAIVIKADGKDGDIQNIKNKDNLSAASYVMLPPTNNHGELLRLRLNNFKDYLTTLISDPQKRENVAGVLTTWGKNGEINKSWEETIFDNMPVMAAITLLTKLQSDVRYAEGEVLNTLLTNVDIGDVRVNQLSAFVVPNSRIVMRGGKYSANIVLAAVDTTQRPMIFIGGNKLSNENGLYEVMTGRSGTFDYSGYIEVSAADGTKEHHDFKSSYTVIDPMATISATMMNVLYAGIGNPISIAVPGVPNSAISATITNGTLSRNGDSWVAHPTKVGSEATISVTATIDGRSQQVGSTTFKVRKLPDPLPYIAYNDAKGNQERYKGSRPFSKTLLLQASGLSAAIDDDMLNVAYRVISFETVFFDSMGNAIPEVSAGNQFSQRQKDRFKNLSRGKRFYISRVKAVGPDGIERTLAPMEVIVN